MKNDFNQWFSKNYPHMNFDGLAPFAQKRILEKFKDYPDVKEKQRKYYQRPDVKEKKRKYYQRPDVKEKQRKYYQRPDVKEKQRNLAETRRKFHQLPLSERRRIILNNHRRLM